MEADKQCCNMIPEYETIFVAKSMHSCRIKSINKSRRKRIQEVAGVKQGTGLFELLAAVAGEFLKDGNVRKVDQDTKLRQSEKVQKRLKTSAEKPVETVSFISSPASPAKVSSLNESVKLSIKSFNVPELIIDLPESATVASLKDAVMDATTNLLSGGLRVRVYMNGSKVPDENVTLAQIGISCVEKLNSLKFMLEPTSPGSGDPLHLLSNAATTQPLPLYQSDKVPIYDKGTLDKIACRQAKAGKEKRPGGSGITQTTKEHISKCDPSGCKKSCKEEISTLQGFPRNCNKAFPVEQEMVPPYYPTVACVSSIGPIVSMTSESLHAKQHVSSLVEFDDRCPGAYPLAPGIIVQHPDSGGEAMRELDLMTGSPKPLVSVEGSKRRMRRPFSIREVEALVLAVEKLGLGRWRDVKLWAFDHAKHRTYVDLKDKWKTLVHTARIAPHQRRGEQVPEELLERVIRAHTFWTMQQAKEQAEL